MDEMYRWTRWAAPGGRGHGMIGWVAIVGGAVAAIWTFHSVTQWWLALLAAAFAWLVGTGLIGVIWALVLRVIEKREGVGSSCDTRWAFMKPETEEHLKKVEGAVAEANHILAQHDYPDNSRTVIVIGLLATMIEHHRAMLLLIRNRRVGSAFALARSIVESMYRGMWINACATDQQIQAFEADDKFPVNMPDMAKAIDETYRSHGFFEDLRKRGWAALCSYTHSGMLQLGRRFREHKVQPNYDDREIYESTTTVTTCILLLAGKFLAYQHHAAECEAVEGLVVAYAPASLVKPATSNAEQTNLI
jgi:uncharacterized protein DUF6988